MEKDELKGKKKSLSPLEALSVLQMITELVRGNQQIGYEYCLTYCN